MYKGEGSRRTSSRKEWSLARSRVAANLLLRNFGSSSAAKRRESVLDFHLQMENCEKEMSEELGEERGFKNFWLDKCFFSAVISPTFGSSSLASSSASDVSSEVSSLYSDVDEQGHNWCLDDDRVLTRNGTLKAAMHLLI